MSSQRVGVGVIGQGFIGRAHSLALQAARRLSEHPVDLVPTVLCGRDLPRAEQNAETWGYERATGDWLEVVGADDVQLVCVFASNDLHHPAELAALERGKSVLCEKPLGRTLDESTEMLAASAQSDGLHACSFNYRYVPAVQLARRLIGGGQLGRVSHFRAHYLQDWGWRAPHGWHHEERRAGTGAIGDYCHIIDLAHHLVGDIERVAAESRAVASERVDREGVSRAVTVEDAYVAAGRFRDGALLSLEASRVASGRKARQWFEVNGEQGSVRWDMEDLNHLWFHRAADGPDAGVRRILVTEREHPFLADWWPTGHVLGWEHTLIHQWGSIRASLAAGELQDPQASFEDGWRADAVVNALSRSARSLVTTRVEDGNRRPGTVI